MRLLIILLLLFLNSSAQELQLQRTYYVEHPYVLLSDITKEPKKDVQLLNFEPNKHILRVKEELLRKIVLKYGYTSKKKHFSYIEFKQKSPIDTKKLRDAITQLYKKMYKRIDIENIDVQPRTYIPTLPKNYTIGFVKRSHLSNRGTCYIKTPKNKKIFFNYYIKAYLPAFFTTKTLKRGEELTKLNTEKKSIILEKFRALPLQEITTAQYEAKHHIQKGKLLTNRDVCKLFLIKRGADVTVTLKENGIFIIFRAKALQSARMGESIRLEQKNGKRLNGIVTGKNRAIIQ
jgi:flagella basal body P-ring formation protein FlgA